MRDPLRVSFARAAPRLSSDSKGWSSSCRAGAVRARHLIFDWTLMELSVGTRDSQIVKAQNERWPIREEPSKRNAKGATPLPCGSHASLRLDVGTRDWVWRRRPLHSSRVAREQLHHILIKWAWLRAQGSDSSKGSSFCNCCEIDNETSSQIKTNY